MKSSKKSAARKSTAKTKRSGKAGPRKAARAVAQRAKPAHRAAAKVARKPQAIPAGYASITPYLIVDDAAAAIDFYKKAFGAREKLRFDMPGGRIGHAELKFGDSLVMLADEYPDHQALSPRTIGGTPVTIHLYVKNVDQTVELAISAGATVMRPVENQFYGDRAGSVQDPFGHTWHVATHVEDVPAKEVARRAQALAAKQGEMPAGIVEIEVEIEGYGGDDDDVA